jgi:NADP-dependent 3-hydroxy acid dehydrogenase YdfG
MSGPGPANLAEAAVADRLDGTVALITGASSGIGAATARELAGLGAAVSLVARRSDRLEDLATSIRGQGGRALVLKADITDEPQAREVVDRTAAELGRLDTLVNNAGVMLLGPVADAPMSEWQRMININLLGLLYCTHAALPLLLDAVETSPRRVADIVNVSSVAGRTIRSGSAVYNATKHGVGAFTEALRQEVTRRYLRVSVVEPGAVETELVSHNRPEIRSGLEARFEEQERMQASDIAEIVSFIVTRPRRTALNEVLVRPTDQER